MNRPTRDVNAGALGVRVSQIFSVVQAPFARHFRLHRASLPFDVWPVPSVQVHSARRVEVVTLGWRQSDDRKEYCVADVLPVVTFPWCV